MNEFDYEGTILVAKDQPDMTCEGCYFEDDDNWCTLPGLPACTPSGSWEGQQLGRHVVWMEKAKVGQ